MTRLRLPRFSELATATLLLTTMSCSQCQTGVDSTGNLDRVNDVVVVQAPDGVSYAVTANPDLLHLRMLDLTAGRFLQSPNRFFPLSTPSAAWELAVAVDVETTAEDGSRIFGLDSATDTIDVVHTSDSADDEAPFTVLSSFATGSAPGDLAALRFANTTVIAVTLPDAGAVEFHAVDDAHAATLLTTIVLPAGAHPERIVADPLGRAFIVSDAVVGVLYAIEPANDGSAVGLVRTVDVGGPVGHLAAGVVDVGDGIAPVVLALRTDIAAAMVVRLFRPGFPEDRYALLGGAELPRLGVQAYVPDVRPTAAPLTVCCTALVNQTEPTSNFAAVTIADGTLLYLQLAAERVDGLVLGGSRRAVRLVDDDSAPAGPTPVRDIDGNVTGVVDVNAVADLWVPASGGDDRRPTATFTAVDTFGSPPFVPLWFAASSLLLVYDGGANSELGSAVGLLGTFSDDTFVSDLVSDDDLVVRDVRVGDIARLQPHDGPAGCNSAYRARIVAVDGLSVVVATDGGGASDLVLNSDDVAACLSRSNDVRLTVEVGNAFAVSHDGRFLQRLAFGDPVVMPGVHLTMTASAAGPPLSGSRLAIPLDPRVTTRGLNLITTGGVLAMVPTGLTGGTVVIPDASSDDTTDTIAARRMVMTAGAADTRISVPALFTFDEAEVTITSVERLQ